MKPRASIIIVNWNGLRFLGPLFDALSRQTIPSEQFEVIMVDNNSTRDQSVAFTQEHYPWVKVITNHRNDGFAGGNNIGMRAAKGDYIVLLNNDTIPAPSWLEELIKVADDKQAGAVVSKLMFAKRPGIINNAGSILRPDSTWPVFEVGANEKDQGQYDQIQEISAFCGASVLLSRRMLEQIGLFDKLFFMYFEDGDLSWRGQKAGWKYYLAPKSVVQHIHTGSSGEHSPLFTFFVSRNRILILFKNAKFRVALVGLLAVLRDRLLIGLKRLAASAVTGRGRKEAISNMWIGIKVAVAAVSLIPVMLLKRWRILPEAKLQ